MDGQVKASAPGKIHLIGEHSVVYGEPAILAAVGKRFFVEAGRSEYNHLVLKHKKKELTFSAKEGKELAEKLDNMWATGNEKGDFSELFSFFMNNYWKGVVSKILQVLKIQGGVSLVAHSDIPPGAGMGSSAAFAVAATRAIAQVYGIELSLERVNEIAYEIEKFAHGKPSGGDNSACCFGGLIWFERGEPPVIRRLKEEVPYKLEGFALVYTGKPEKTTGELVQNVRNLDAEFRNIRIKTLGNATRDMLEALKARDMEKVKGLMNLAQKNLKELGVSTDKIDSIAEKVRKIGGAAKLCGAGGGGIMLCWHQDKEKLIQALKEMGESPIEADLGVQGVRLENHMSGSTA